MLDPRRIGLNAESVGFLKRTGQEVDWRAFDHAMQTEYNNQNSAVDVRRLKETPVNEIHVMGGELRGFESNELILTKARQERQLNGYPLRQFDAKNPAVVLPKKYGGFPLYNRNQTEYPEFVSVFTEPMSAPLQSDTLLLGRAGTLPVTHNSLHAPYEAGYFVDPMSSSYDALSANQAEFKQRRHLQNMSAKSKKQRHSAGIFVSANGQPMSQVDDAAAGAAATMGAFARNVANHSARVASIQSLSTLTRSSESDGYDGGASESASSAPDSASSAPLMQSSLNMSGTAGDLSTDGSSNSIAQLTYKASPTSITGTSVKSGSNYGKSRGSSISSLSSGHNEGHNIIVNPDGFQTPAPRKHRSLETYLADLAAIGPAMIDPSNSGAAAASLSSQTYADTTIKYNPSPISSGSSGSHAVTGTHQKSLKRIYDELKKTPHHDAATRISSDANLGTFSIPKATGPMNGMQPGELRAPGFSFAPSGGSVSSASSKSSWRSYEHESADSVFSIASNSSLETPNTLYRRSMKNAEVLRKNVIRRGIREENRFKAVKNQGKVRKSKS